jgi:periplasmic copper chaperone A
MSPITRELTYAMIFLSWLVPQRAPKKVLLANIVATQAWSRATPGGSKVAGGYLTIENREAVTDKLL